MLVLAPLILTYVRAALRRPVTQRQGSLEQICQEAVSQGKTASGLGC